jgi:hypothetical protein
LQAAHQEVFRIVIAAQPAGNLGEHANGGRIVGIFLQVIAQQALSPWELVLTEREGSGHQLRRPVRRFDVAGVSALRTLVVPQHRQLRRELAPCIG